jgi:hypothetical protein
MQPVIPTPPTAPQVSLSIETEVWMGQNQLRRSLGRAVSLLIGQRVVDEELILPPGDTLDINKEIQGFLATANGALNVTVNTYVDSTHSTPHALTMSLIMAMDQHLSSLVFHNPSTTDTVTLHVSYLVPIGVPADA